MAWAALLILLLALTRLTHLLADDVILSGPRDWMVKKSGTYWGYLWTCTWCMSIWVCGPGALLAWHQGWVPHDAWLGWALWPALSYGVVMLEATVEGLYGAD